MDADLVKLRVKDVRTAVPAGNGVEAGLVVLEEEEFPFRNLRMYIGQPEARAIHAAWSNTVPPRPSTWDLFVSTIAILDGRIERAVITDVEEERHFFAQLVIARAGDNAPLYVTARPSDALALALRAYGAELCAEQHVMVEAGLLADGSKWTPPPEPEPIPDPEPEPVPEEIAAIDWPSVGHTDNRPDLPEPEPEPEPAAEDTQSVQPPTAESDAEIATGGPAAPATEPAVAAATEPPTPATEPPAPAVAAGVPPSPEGPAKPGKGKRGKQQSGSDKKRKAEAKRKKAKKRKKLAKAAKRKAEQEALGPVTEEAPGPATPAAPAAPATPADASSGPGPSDELDDEGPGQAPPAAL
ncbi:MAG TPA: bifunctional nuclease family protein [Acidimicrobiales bacterium]|nr:bifunctional nuclease family protein [Acidimicrobiales bacterium]